MITFTERYCGGSELDAYQNFVFLIPQAKMSTFALSTTYQNRTEMLKKKITFCCDNKKNLNENFDKKIQNMQKKIWRVEDSRGDLVGGENSSAPGVKKNGRKNQITR